MGANFCTECFAASDVATLKNNFNSYCDNLRYEEGNGGYAGHLGIAPGLKIKEQVFKNTDEAYEWILNNSKKWEDAIAVKVGDFSQTFPKTVSEKKLLEDYTEIRDVLNSWDASLLKRVKSAKSLFKSCYKCNSKINVKFLKTVNCPICGYSEFLTTETDKKKKDTMYKKSQELSEKIKVAKDKYKAQSEKTFWLVGAWVSS